MSVIIRLQNLPWSANAGDIRSYFQGLSIPEGGVHIVGGEQGDAFIAFSTDEDARQAMLLDGGKLKEIQIKLLLSSRTEMLRVIEQARQQAMKLQNLMSVPPQPLVPQVTLQNAAVVDQNKPEEDDDFNGRKESSRRDRSSSRERRGRSRDKSRSRDRSRDRGRHSRDRDRRRRDRSRDRSRDRYRRRRSRSYDRKRNSRDDKDRYGRDRDRTGKIRDSDNESKDGKGTAETKAVLPESKAASDIQNSAQNVVLQSTEVVTAQPASSPVQVKIPDPPAIPQMLLQFQQNGKEASTAAQQPQAAKQEIPSQAGAAFAFPPSAYTTSAVAPQQAMPPMNQEQWAQMAGMQMPMMNSNVVMPPRGPMMTPEMAMNFPGGFPMAQPGMAAFQPGMYPPNFPPMTPDMWRMATPMTMDPMQQVAQQQVPTELCVEIRGLPSNASYVDIKKLFNECSISSDGIKMINDTQGYRTGIAYVKFSSPEHLQIALNQDGQKVRNTSVEVLTLRSSIFDSAIDNFKPEKDKSRVDARNLKKDVDTRQARVSPVQSPREIVDPRLQRNSSQPAYSTDTAKNKPLPASVTLKTKMISIKGATNTSDRDVHDFFSEVGISPSNINFVPDSTGTQILCLFETEEEADKAITKSNSYLGRSLVMVEKVPEQGPNDSYQNRKRGSSRERDRDRRDGKDESRLSRRGRDRPSRFDKPRDELRDEMPSARVSPPLRDPRRPPLLVNPGQGQDMQGGGPMMGMNEPRMPNDGMMDHPMIDRHPSMMDRQGPPMGRMMMDPMCNDGPFMERPPNRFQIDRRPGMDGPRMNGPPGMDGPRMNGPPGMDGPRMNGPPGMDGPRMNGPPMMGCPPMMDGPMRGGRFPNGPRGPMGDGPFNNRFNNQQNDDGWRDGPMRRGPMNDRRDPRGDRMDRRDDRRRNFDERPSRFNNDPRNGPRSRMMDNADQRSNRPGSPFIDNESVDNFGQPGCVIALENVNFRADIDDILSFFNGFDINNEDVIRRFDEKGRPTGDARVAFKTPMEANRAVEMLNHNNMLGRPVNMYVL